MGGAEGPVGDVTESEWQVQRPRPQQQEQEQEETSETLARAAKEAAPRSSQPSPKEKGKAKKGKSKKGKTKTKTKDGGDDDDEDEDSSSTEGGRYNEWPRPWQRPANVEGGGGEGGAPLSRGAEETASRRDAHDSDPYTAFGLFEEYSPTPFKQRQPKGKERDEGKGGGKSSRVKKASKSSQDLKRELKKQTNVSTDSFFSDPSVKASLEAGHFKAKPHRLPYAGGPPPFLLVALSAHLRLSLSLSCMSSVMPRVHRPASADLKSQLAPLLLPDTIPEKVLNARLQSWGTYLPALTREHLSPSLLTSSPSFAFVLSSASSSFYDDQPPTRWDSCVSEASRPGRSTRATSRSATPSLSAASARNARFEPKRVRAVCHRRRCRRLLTLCAALRDVRPCGSSRWWS
jgi:hypothetical protein